MCIIIIITITIIIINIIITTIIIIIVIIIIINVKHCYSTLTLRLDLSWDQGRWSLVPDSLDLVPWKATALKRWIVADRLTGTRRLFTLLLLLLLLLINIIIIIVVVVVVIIIIMNRVGAVWSCCYWGLWFLSTVLCMKVLLNAIAVCRLKGAGSDAW